MVPNTKDVNDTWKESDTIDVPDKEEKAATIGQKMHYYSEINIYDMGNV